MYIPPIPFDDLSNYSGRSIDDLKAETYLRLEALTEQMKQEKANDRKNRNAKDEEFQRIVKKYFTMWDFLRKWWSEEKIILAVSRQAEVTDLVSELEIRQNAPCPYPKGEYITTRMGYLPRYTKNGEELASRERTRCDVYRIPNQYQASAHGRIILDLLYGRYPELKEFDFEAYGWYGYERDGYEIYPANKIYTPFAALMDGDIEAIKERNRSYARSYNHGEYTILSVAERLGSEEAEHYFDVIAGLHREEREEMK